MPVLSERQWERIDKRSKPHPIWKGCKAYTFCSRHHEGEETRDFFRDLRQEANTYGWRLVHDEKHYYLIKCL